jgi:predicted transcriptional regulator
MKSTEPYKAEAYHEACALRKRGLTYSEIAKICGVSKGTVSAWLATESFSQVVAERNRRRAATDNRRRIVMINQARARERATQTKAVLKIAETEYKHYRHSPLFIAGVMLYVSEGDTTHPRLIRMASSRPDLHRIFVRFMADFMGVPRSDVRFWLLLYPDLDETTCMKHWMKQVGISVSQFYKNQYIEGRSRNRTLHFGVGNTIIGSTLLKQKLMKWVELATKELKN